MVTCAVYQILTSVFKVIVLLIVVVIYLGVSFCQGNGKSMADQWEDNIDRKVLAIVLVLFFMVCLVAHSVHTEATYRSNIQSSCHYIIMHPRPT